MAGIGFRLQRILSEDTYSGTLKAFTFSSILMAGPMILTILCLSFVHWTASEFLTVHEQAYLRGIVTYCYALSFVIFGPFQMAVTRYLADGFYQKHTTNYTAVFFSTLSFAGLVFGPLVVFYLSTLSVSLMTMVNAWLLCIFIVGIWISLLFLSAAEDYTLPVRAFFLGCTTSLFSAIALGRHMGLDGYLAGFVLGQGLIFVLFTVAIFNEFGYKETWDYYWLGYFKRYPFLVGIGIFLALGIWVDKVIFWASAEGEFLDRTMRYSPTYDGPMFLAYLTVLPALAYFLIQMETDFAVKFRSYFTAIQSRKGIQELEKKRQEMATVLANSLQKLVLIQTVISGACLILVPWFTAYTRLDPIYMNILRIGILASFLQVGFLILLNMLLYFDAQREAFWSTAVFFGANAIFTDATLRFGLPAYGFGLAAASLLALTLAFYFLNERMKHLHFWTFMKQPLFKPVFMPRDEDLLTGEED